MTDFDFADMAAQLADIGVDDTDDMTAWDTLELNLELRRLDKALADRKELLHPTTQEARDMHSRRGAVVVALHRRGKM